LDLLEQSRNLVEADNWPTINQIEVPGHKKVGWISSTAKPTISCYQKKKLKSFTQNLISPHAQITEGMRWMTHTYKAIGERRSDFNPGLHWWGVILNLMSLLFRRMKKKWRHPSPFETQASKWIQKEFAWEIHLTKPKKCQVSFKLHSKTCCQSPIPDLQSR
jgi:hypothetical protein